MIEIVHYSPKYELPHYQFATQYWKKRKRITSEYIYWKFRGEQKQDLSSFILAIENDVVIGQLGLIPCTIIVEGQKVESQWACDLMVDKKYRGKGVAKLLYDYAYTLKSVTLGSDPSPSASVSMKRAGFVALNGPFKFMFPIYLGEITKLKGINSNLLDRIPNPFIYVLWIWKLLRINKTNSFVNATIKYENETLTSDIICVSHDLSFTNWRYNSFKDYYSGIEFYSNESQTSYSVLKSKNLYLITQFSANSIAAILDILCRNVLEAKKNNVSKIKLMANTKREIYLLSILGFIKFRTRTEIIFYCSEAELNQKMTNKYFFYTYMDSDENI